MHHLPTHTAPHHGTRQTSLPEPVRVPGGTNRLPAGSTRCALAGLDMGRLGRPALELPPRNVSGQATSAGKLHPQATSAIDTVTSAIKDARTPVTTSTKWPPTTTSLHISTTTYIVCHSNMKSCILAFANSFVVFLASFSGSLALICASFSAASFIAFLIASMFANLVFGSTTTRLRLFGPRSSSIYDSKLCILLWHTAFCADSCPIRLPAFFKIARISLSVI
jgi:hypothetical protein